MKEVFLGGGVVSSLTNCRNDRNQNQSKGFCFFSGCLRKVFVGDVTEKKMEGNVCFNYMSHLILYICLLLAVYC